MMTKHSLRLTTLVFKIQVLFDATFTLNCSRFIGFCRKFYLISSITQNEHLFPFEQSFYAELQHFPGSSYLNGETFVCLNQHQNSFIKTFEERFFTLDTQHAHGTSFDSFEKILVPISSHDHSFWIFIQPFDITYFQQHLHNLISEGKTNLWAEYNDGYVQRGGIHSLLFVIYLLNNFHIFAE